MKKRMIEGFTLIELVIAVAIIAILAAVAYPAYINYIVRSNRAAAQSYMMEVSALQHQYLLDTRSYAASMSDLDTSVPEEVSRNYSVTTESDATATPPSFLVTAEPIGNQLNRDTGCATLTIDQTGEKAVSGTYGVAKCW
jgi:type IV pilus assembly protein PilE